jgi:hypothetical protein
MANSFSPKMSYLPRGLFVLALVALVLGVIFRSQLPAETQAQTRAKPAESQAGTPAKRAAVPSASLSGSDVFLELAKTVGLEVPAKRLIDHKLGSDPSSLPRYWAIVDFRQRSTSKRFFVFDTIEKRIEAYYVSHGRGSEGATDDGMADVFSNQEGSLSSSLGIYRALDEYVGQHGRSMRLAGLEPTNSNALGRAIVLHTADYVSEAFIRQTGRLGRSEGCFAVERAVGDQLIDRLKNGAYIIAWRN